MSRDLPSPGAAADAPGRSPGAPDGARPSAARAHARAVLETLDLHCAGEPLRLVTTGLPEIPDLPILARRRWVAAEADWVRRAILLEPRGHRDQYGAIVLPPHRPDADRAVLFLHTAGYSTMCGHGIIALTTGLIEEGLHPATAPQTTIRWETPAGLVTAEAAVAAGAHGGPVVTGVRFANVPAWRDAAGIVAAPDGVALHGAAAARGGLALSVAFGGAFYAIADAAELGLRVVPGQAAALTRAGAAITELLRRDHRPVHPEDPDLGFLYGTIIVDHDPATSPDGRARDATLRNVTVFADAEVDRSPCGSGTSALLADLHAAGRLAPGTEVVNAGITGEAFRARIEAVMRTAGRTTVATTVAGRAFLTGTARHILDARDPLADGFLLGAASGTGSGL